MNSEAKVVFSKIAKFIDKTAGDLKTSDYLDLLEELEADIEGRIDSATSDLEKEGEEEDEEEEGAEESSE